MQLLRGPLIAELLPQLVQRVLRTPLLLASCLRLRGLDPVIVSFTVVHFRNKRLKPLRVRLALMVLGELDWAGPLVSLEGFLIPQ